EILPGEEDSNPFPDDVSPKQGDLFLSVLAHELNHIVDAYAVYLNPELRAREAELIAEAGCDPLNYLRSILPECFFRDAPQEFFASIANIWFVDTVRTFDLAVVRFDQGRPSPLDQALFFAEVYSMGTDRTYFYRSDTTAKLDRTPAYLGRDVAGRITSIAIDQKIWHFIRDIQGDVIGVEVRFPRLRSVRRP
ncbi:MAG: hypothetical protein R3338_05385, partial [Thermoanaerobaculia bacterium]|nr:hypothetical protein [Thermoanaerobaculia bacterium]